MGITPDPEQRASNIAEAIGSATSKAGPVIVAILTLSGLIAADTWLLRQSLTHGQETCRQVLTMLEQDTETRSKRINLMITALLERADPAARAEVDAILGDISKGVRQNRNDLLLMKQSLYEIQTSERRGR